MTEESEHNIKELSEALAAANAEKEQLKTKLGEITTEQQLMHRLTKAGASDIESALAVAKGRLKGITPQALDDCIEQLRKEKTHLFMMKESGQQFATPLRTAGAHQKIDAGAEALAAAANKAAASGNRRDLQQYLKLRRNYR